MVKFIQKNISCADALNLPVPDVPANFPVLWVVAAALVDRDNRILLAQRPEGKSLAGLWEFPGGKVEQGEIPEYALMRELREELAIETRPCGFSPVAFASHSYDSFHLLMPLYICRVWDGIPLPQEKQNLKWVKAEDLNNYDMPAADIPLIAPLQAVI